MSKTVGLDPVLPALSAQPVAPLNIRGAPLPNGVQIKTNDDIDTTPVPMDLEPEMEPAQATRPSAVPVSQADIENELREFLESGSAGTMSSSGHDANDANVLDQIMMH